jgi:hypothetical protein
MDNTHLYNMIILSKLDGDIIYQNIEKNIDLYLGDINTSGEGYIFHEGDLYIDDEMCDLIGIYEIYYLSSRRANLLYYLNMRHGHKIRYVY